MTDGHASEPVPGTPGKRALGAMESAVRRVREAQGAGPAPPPRVPEPRDTPPPPPTGTSTPRPGGWADPWLVGAVVVAATLVVLAAAALAASLTSSTSPTTVSAPSGTSSLPAPPPPGHGEGQGSTSSTSTSTSTSTTTTTAVAPAGGPPVISALDPASGTPGQGIEVAGANFLSPDGQIVATFNGQVAPTSCPAQNACTVTVPPSGTSRSAQVTITTAGGTSNSVTFTYS